MDECRDQWKGFLHAYQTGRLAHAYILIGDPRGIGRRFAEAALTTLFDAESDPHLRDRLMSGAHPDVIWIEPKSTNREILIGKKGLREDGTIRELVRRMQQTATEGSWKAAVILAAERMNDSAANAFLKSLEEPSGQTLFLLVTDAEQALLPTITSRCHRIVLSYQEPHVEGEWREPVLDILRSFGGQDPLQMVEHGEALGDILKSIKSRIERDMKTGFDKEQDNEKVFAARVSAVLKEQQAGLLKMLLGWQRDLLYCVVGADQPAKLRFPEEIDILRQQAQQLNYAICMKRINAVEDMARRLDRNLPAAFVFEAGLAAQLGRKRV